MKNHVLVCNKHKDDAANQEVLEQFKERCMKSSSLPSFSREIKLKFHTEHIFTSKSSKDSINNKGIYLLQSIKVNSNKLNIFYDNGCSDFIVSENAVKLLGKHAKKQNADTIQLGGVGNMTIESIGAYNVTLPQYNGQMITLSGICIHQVTSDFPIYPLKDVENDIQQHYTSSGGTNSLPRLPSAVGGEIHLMVGVRYLRYYPKPVHQLPFGLTLFQSSFSNPNRERYLLMFTRISSIHQIHQSSSAANVISSEGNFLKKQIFHSLVMERFIFQSMRSQNPHKPICQNCKDCLNK